MLPLLLFEIRFPIDKATLAQSRQVTFPLHPATKLLDAFLCLEADQQLKPLFHHGLLRRGVGCGHRPGYQFIIDFDVGSHGPQLLMCKYGTIYVYGTTSYKTAEDSWAVGGL